MSLASDDAPLGMAFMPDPDGGLPVPSDELILLDSIISLEKVPDNDLPLYIGWHYKAPEFDTIIKERANA